MLRREFIKSALIGSGSLGLLTLPFRAAHAKSQINIVDFGAKSLEGYNNAPHIQAAIDALPSGGSVFIPSGVFEVNFDQSEMEEPGIGLHSNITIYGEGKNSVLSFSGQTDKRIHVIRNFDFKNGNENLYVKNLSIHCNYQGNYRDSTGKKDLRINAITFKNADNCSVEEVECLDGHGYGIWFSNTHSSKIRECVVRDFGDGIELSEEASYNTILDNLVFSTGKVHWIGSFILCYTNAHHNIIARNRMKGGAGQALSVVSAYGHGNNNVFYENTVDTYNTVGIYLAGEHNTIINNSVSTIQQPAILFYKESESRDTLLISNKLHANLLNATPVRQYVITIESMHTGLLVSGNKISMLGGKAFPNQISDELIPLNTVLQYEG